MPKRRTFKTEECTFVFNDDFSGDIHMVMPADSIEINGLKLDEGRTAMVTVALPFEALKSMFFHYMKSRVKQETKLVKVAEALLEPFRE